MFITVRDKFTFGRLLLFSLPSIIMMIFTSIYGVVDGFFVSNFVGKTPFAAVNYIMPVLMILGAVGFMFGTGGSAIVASTMGAGDGEKAKRRFSLIVYATVACGMCLAQSASLCCLMWRRLCRRRVFSCARKSTVIEQCLQKVDISAE